MKKRQGMLRHFALSLLGLGLVCNSTGCAPKLLGPTTPAGYFFTLEVSPNPIWLRTVDAARAASFPNMAECIVRVQDARGQPVDSVPVTFEVEPGWVHSASISPSQAQTRGGIARALFQAQTTGVVRVLAHVDQTTAQTSLTMLTYEGTMHHQ